MGQVFCCWTRPNLPEGECWCEKSAVGLFKYCFVSLAKGDWGKLRKPLNQDRLFRHRDSNQVFLDVTTNLLGSTSCTNRINEHFNGFQPAWYETKQSMFEEIEFTADGSICIPSFQNTSEVKFYCVLYNSAWRNIREQVLYQYPVLWFVQIYNE